MSQKQKNGANKKLHSKMLKKKQEKIMLKKKTRQDKLKSLYKKMNEEE